MLEETIELSKLYLGTASQDLAAKSGPFCHGGLVFLPIETVDKSDPATPTLLYKKAIKGAFIIIL